jgi:hypothetical protein
MEGREESMQVLTAAKAALLLGKPIGWINWAGRHPGIVLLGALAMAILTLQKSPGTLEPEYESSDEEVPLFI